MDSAKMFSSASSFTPRARRSLLRQSQAEVQVDAPPFSLFLNSVLGSPFLTTSDLPAVPDFDLDVEDGTFAIAPVSIAVTTSPSIDFNMIPPRPSSCSILASGSRRATTATFSSVRKSPKGIFPRIWDVLSSPGKKGKGKAKFAFYYDDQPLDGEEGELIDDEACFIDVPAITGIDIVARLPAEVSVHILKFLDLPSIVACLSVSKTWRALAEDNAVWRQAFYQKNGWIVDFRRVKPSLSSRVLPRLSIVSRRSSSTSVVSRVAPLVPDWRSLYKTRLELDKRWATGEAKVTRITGHTDSVYCLEFDSKRIITGSRDRTVKVWSIAGKFIGSFRGHAGSVLCLKFDKDWDVYDSSARGFMVTGSSDYSIIVWDLFAGGSKAEVKAVLNGHTGGVLDLRIDRDYIVSCSKDTLIRVWNRSNFELYTTLRGHQGPVNAVGLQDHKVVSASGDGKMMMWDIKTGKNLRTFEGHDRGLACIEFKDDLIVSGSNDCKIKVWSASKGECLQTLIGHDLLVRALSFDPVTNRLVSASYDTTVKVWDLYTGRMVREFKNNHISHIFDVKFDARRIVSTSHDQQIVVLDFSEGLDTAMFV